ncbi:hypothetical protein [Rhizobium sp. Root1203]|uniref:hypothetical protein n=1 Tax=Rhizobium sp. Root1203 TaxID=1736427 RepID=UPI001FCD0F07|nr:hypothetical protein [Rhizobium sp. Root1203]
MTASSALRLEIIIIGLGLLALSLIFQPFHLTLFAVGSALVVLAALLNNLLPLAAPGVSARSVVTGGLIVALIFFVVVLVAIAAAHFYGAFFLKQPDSATYSGKSYYAATPFYLTSFYWVVAAIASALALTIACLVARRP